MKIEGDIITFSSGNTVSANCGVIGLKGMQVSEGWDGGLWNPDDIEWVEESDFGYMSLDDLTELADYMIEQWGKFKIGVQELRNETKEE